MLPARVFLPLLETSCLLSKTMLAHYFLQEVFLESLGSSEFSLPSLLDSSFGH